MDEICNELAQLDCQYACYIHQQGQPAFMQGNCQRFLSASVIKVPILLAWLTLEHLGEVDRNEQCNLGSELQVEGAGFSWLLSVRSLPYHDVLLMMIALSDNLCTNLVIQRAGLDRITQVLQQNLKLPGADLQRKLMDYEARGRGLDNWITAQDCIRMFELIRCLPPSDRQFVDTLLGVNQDDLLLRRNIPRDTIVFHHKSGSMNGVLHDWGYTDNCEIFLLTQGVKSEPAVFEVFGKIGQVLIPE
jgi:beta-lactamase class A